MSGSVERFEAAMNQGHNAAWDQMWDRAAMYYRQALAEIPNDTKALNSLALALLETEQYEEALANYLKVTQQSPDDPIPLEKAADLFALTGKAPQAIEAYMRSAERYLKMRDVNKSIEVWLRVINLQPGHIVARSRLALVYERLGRKPDAVKEYLAIASLLQHAGEVQKAIQAANRALKVDPSSAESQQSIALIKAGTMLPPPSKPLQQSPRPIGRPKTGELELEPEEENPDPIAEASQKALAALAALMFESDGIEESESTRRGMADIVRGAFKLESGQVDRTRILLHLSQIVDLQTKGRFDQAAEEIEKAIEIGLEHPAAFFDHGYLLMELGKYEKALESLSRVTGHDDFDLAARLLRGKAHLEMENHAKAAADCLEALKLADMTVVPQDQAQIIGQMYDPIIEAQTQRTDGDPPIKMCQSILDLLIQKNWKRKLEEARRQLPDQDDANPVPLAEILTAGGSNEVVDALSRIRRLVRSGKTNAAMEEAFYVLNSAVFYLPLHILIAEILLQQGQFDSALEKLNTVARSYEVRDEFNRAIGLYRRISDLSPMDISSRQNLIDLMVRNGQNEAAIAEYLRLSEMHYNMADLNSVRKTIGAALTLAQQSNASREIRVSVLTQLADIEMQSLNWRQAVITYEQVRKLQPYDAKTRGSLIDLYFRLGQVKKAGDEIADFTNYLLTRGQSDPALAFLEKLAAQYEQQPVVIHQQADVFRKIGQTEQAIQKMETACELYLNAGDRKSAATVVMAVLAMNPPDATKYQQWLAQIRAG